MTVNAIMLSLPGGEVVDPAGGLNDLREQVLREVDATTFLEDPLRALRVVQFAARLGFAPTPSLRTLCRDAALDELPAERIFVEWEKLLIKGARPSLGFDIAAETGVLDRVFPGLAPWDAEQAKAIDAAAEARDRLDDPGRALALMVAVWLAPSVDRGLDEPSPIGRALDRMGLFRVGGYPARDRVLQALRETASPADDAALRWMSTRCELELTLRARHARAVDDVARTAIDAAGQRAFELGILHEKPAPVLQGRDLQQLGVRGGPQMGEWLKLVYAAQLDGDVTSREEGLALLRSRALIP
jgi:tRNA nucleotidyltransferase (CCA-adding enzyme)